MLVRAGGLVIDAGDGPVYSTCAAGRYPDGASGIGQPETEIPERQAANAVKLCLKTFKPDDGY
ncbi:hypothetical protein [Mucilaginibacter sp.]|uniref:hypothetical protein n=1 Tax=Mucilaginibacter sp. TaxID=1882438 RepID=UPI0026309193|nr:hypothetical protein [Mucilaginibacter sp.]